MRRCPCGCGGRVKPGRTYATRTCNLTLRSRSYWQQIGREGGAACRAVRQRNLVDALAHLDREAAIVEAYRRGRRAAYHTRDWQRLRAKRKAV